MSSVKATQIPAKKFTSAEIAQLRKEFKQLDTDHSGKLDQKELLSLITQLGLPANIVQLIIRLYDTNHDGQITFDEFTVFLGEFSKVAEDPTLFHKLLFRVLDTDKSGYLDEKEIVEFVSCFSETKISLADAKKLITALDNDGDGKLNFDEAMKIFA